MFNVKKRVNCKTNNNTICAAASKIDLARAKFVIGGKFQNGGYAAARDNCRRKEKHKNGLQAGYCASISFKQKNGEKTLRSVGTPLD